VLGTSRCFTRGGLEQADALLGGARDAAASASGLHRQGEQSFAWGKHANMSFARPSCAVYMWCGECKVTRMGGGAATKCEVI
jgi:hypothetical protein